MLLFLNSACRLFCLISSFPTLQFPPSIPSIPPAMALCHQRSPRVLLTSQTLQKTLKTIHEPNTWFFLLTTSCPGASLPAAPCSCSLGHRCLTPRLGGAARSPGERTFNTGCHSRGPRSPGQVRSAFTSAGQLESQLRRARLAMTTKVHALPET